MTDTVSKNLKESIAASLNSKHVAFNLSFFRGKKTVVEVGVEALLAPVACEISAKSSYLQIDLNHL